MRPRWPASSASAAATTSGKSWPPRCAKRRARRAPRARWPRRWRSSASGRSWPRCAASSSKFSRTARKRRGRRARWPSYTRSASAIPSRRRGFTGGRSISMPTTRWPRGDHDAAVVALREAFIADPASRTAFTTLERICYKREKWRDAMELYDKAIELVETGACRAYRLADLYARRGQLQLQYLAQPGEAAASYLRVLELDPENDTA